MEQYIFDFALTIAITALMSMLSIIIAVAFAAAEKILWKKIAKAILIPTASNIVFAVCGVGLCFFGFISLEALAMSISTIVAILLTACIVLLLAAFVAGIAYLVTLPFQGKLETA